MTRRRDILSTIVGSTALLAGCTGITNTQSTPENTTSFPPRPPTDPYYPNELDSAEVLTNHKEGLRQQGGHRTIGSIDEYNGDFRYPSEITFQDSIDRAYAHSGNGEVFYTGSKLYGYSSEQYINASCDSLRLFTDIFTPAILDLSTLISNATYVYEGVRSKVGLPLQKYISNNKQMIPSSLNKRKDMLSAITKSDLSSVSAENIHTVGWHSELWFDANKIARYQSLEYKFRIDGGNSYSLSLTTQIRDVGDRSISSPGWLNNAKATVDGQKCSRFPEIHSG